jgi:hypothetical protein
VVVALEDPGLDEPVLHRCGVLRGPGAGPSDGVMWARPSRVILVRGPSSGGSPAGASQVTVTWASARAMRRRSARSSIRAAASPSSR